MSARPRGRPLRFMALVLGGWLASRAWWLWPVPATLLPPGVHPLVPAVLADTRGAPPAIAPRATTRASSTLRASPAPPRMTTPARPRTIELASVADAPTHGSGSGRLDTAPAGADRHALALLGMVRYGAPPPPQRGGSRWSGSAWAILRDSRQRAGVATPQLGGSQIGARLAYALDVERRVAIAARVSSAVAARQQEAAVGIEWQPRGLPVRVAVERRIGIAGIRGGTAVGLSGGVSDRALGRSLRLDGYAQAGAIARDGVEGYADGAMRVARPIGHGAAGTTFDLGLGAWGAAQRGAARLDIGPTAAMTLPVGPRRLRLTLDWRQRVAGDARPASGPALSLGTDF